MYKGLYLMLRREFTQAATMFLEAVATFTATEVLARTLLLGLGIYEGTLRIPPTGIAKPAP